MARDLPEAADTVSATVTERLRDLVLSGELPPRTHLREKELSERFGVSRTPVRDALLVLAKEGLLEFGPYRGYAIREFSVGDVLDAYELRAILEGGACRIAAENGLTRKARAAAQDAIDEASRLPGRHPWTDADRTRWCELNRVFHATIVEACGNRQLADAIDRTRSLPILHQGRFAWFVHEQMIDWFDEAAKHRSWAAHAQILAAIVAHDGTLADRLMREHIMAASLILKQNWDAAMGRSLRGGAGARATASATAEPGERGAAPAPARAPARGGTARRRAVARD